LPMVFLLVGACLLTAALRPSSWVGSDRARLSVHWRFDRGDYTYLLRGRYSVTRLSDGHVTSLANDSGSDLGASYIDVPTGLYRVALQPGYTLERFATPSADAAQGGFAAGSGEVVPASLVSPNPVVVTATEGRIAPLRLSLVDMPGTAPEPEATCMNGS
jgi:hypothetical protein